MGKAQGPSWLYTFCKIMSPPVRLLKTVRLLESLEYYFKDFWTVLKIERFAILFQSLCCHFRIFKRLFCCKIKENGYLSIYVRPFLWYLPAVHTRLRGKYNSHLQSLHCVHNKALTTTKMRTGALHGMYKSKKIRKFQVLSIFFR